MYQPPQFKSRDAAVAEELMRQHPFATLVSTDDDGFPFATHLPIHVDATAPGDFMLWAHCAKPNPHWRYLEARPMALVMFMGPHAYQSPKIYPDLARVPSWNYLTVHCKVDVERIDQPQSKDDLLKMLIGDHEPEYAAQWRGLGEEFAQKMLAGITGLKMRVTQWDCKMKVNQHRPESHAALIAGYANGNEDERELAQWMTRLGMGA